LCAPALGPPISLRVIGTRTNGSRSLSNLVDEPSHARFASRTYCCRGGPSAVYSQDSGLVDGRVGSDLSTSSMQSGSTFGLNKGVSAPPGTWSARWLLRDGHARPSCSRGSARFHKTGRERQCLRSWPPRDRKPELEPHLAGCPVIGGTTQRFRRRLGNPNPMCAPG
jgi:hypothetical protein